MVWLQLFAAERISLINTIAHNRNRNSNSHRWPSQWFDFSAYATQKPNHLMQKLHIKHQTRTWWTALDMNVIDLSFFS